MPFDGRSTVSCMLYLWAHCHARTSTGLRDQLHVQLILALEIERRCPLWQETIGFVWTNRVIHKMMFRRTKRPVSRPVLQRHCHESQWLSGFRWTIHASDLRQKSIRRFFFYWWSVGILIGGRKSCLIGVWCFGCTKLFTWNLHEWIHEYINELMECICC